MLKESAEKFYNDNNLEKICNELKKEISELVTKHMSKISAIEQSNDSVLCFYDILMFQSALMARNAYRSCCNEDVPMIYQMNESIKDFSDKLTMIIMQEDMKSKGVDSLSKMLSDLKSTLQKSLED